MIDIMLGLITVLGIQTIVRHHYFVEEVGKRLDYDPYDKVVKLDINASYRNFNRSWPWDWNFRRMIEYSS